MRHRRCSARETGRERVQLSECLVNQTLDSWITISGIRTTMISALPCAPPTLLELQLQHCIVVKWCC